ncbi:hypothetical protein COBT_000064 [Conglomerata obtusa]
MLLKLMLWITQFSCFFYKNCSSGADDEGAIRPVSVKPYISQNMSFSVICKGEIGKGKDDSLEDELEAPVVRDSFRV